jgi:hypothetical protein
MFYCKIREVDKELQTSGVMKSRITCRQDRDAVNSMEHSLSGQASCTSNFPRTVADVQRTYDVTN